MAKLDAAARAAYLREEIPGDALLDVVFVTAAGISLDEFAVMSDEHVEEMARHIIEEFEAELVEHWRLTFGRGAVRMWTGFGG
jgi:hypothetical protein